MMIIIIMFNNTMAQTSPPRQETPAQKPISNFTPVPRASVGAVPVESPLRHPAAKQSRK